MEVRFFRCSNIMINKYFCKKPLWKCSRTLSDVAMGRQPAETVILGATLVNVCTHELQKIPTLRSLAGGSPWSATVNIVSARKQR